MVLKPWEEGQLFETESDLRLIGSSAVRP
ncbi:MAG: hypothetical protein QOF78_119, partial [Phycisphaerales bacterium]|nr:hypothetical protein [Phycisphaerales bacterium]